MEKYDNYKDSGIEWIGEIPEHWENIQIKHLAIGDNTLFLDGDWIESKEIIYDNGEYRYITTGNVGEGKYKEQGNTYITQETFEKLNCTEVVPDDLLISRLNPPIGRSCLVPDLGNKIVTSVDNVILRPSSKYKKNYLVHFFTNTNYFEYTSLVGRGATMQRISRSMLGDIKIALPPTPEEQTAIANYLDRKTTEIDELIADKKRLLELYEEEKTAIINELVTGKKVWDGNAWTEPAEVKDSGIEWLGEIPEHWEVKRLKYVVSLNDETLSEKTDEEMQIDYIEIGGLKNGNIGSTEYRFGNAPSRARRIVRNGDVIVSTVRTYLKAIAQISDDKDGYIASTGFAILRPQKIDSKFLGYYSHSPFFIDNTIANSVGVTYPAINASNILEFPIQIPPIEEQQSIVHHIETECALIDAKTENTKKLIDLLTEYRTALISEVVTGKIKVTE